MPVQNYISVAIQCELESGKKDYSSQYTQYESQNCFSIGTQYEVQLVSREVQCSLENYSKTCCIQCDLQTTCTQCCSEDDSDENNSKLNEVWRYPNDAVTTSELSKTIKVNNSPFKNSSQVHINSSYDLSSSHKDNVSTSLFVQSASAEELKITDNYCTHLTQSGLSSLAQKNVTNGSPFSDVPSKKQRTDTWISSSTSGITEIFGSRFGTNSEEEKPEVSESPKKNVTPKKRLWTPSNDTTSICEESVMDFPSLFPEEQNGLPSYKLNKNNMASVHSRMRYNYDEEVSIIEYISKYNVYNKVGGMSMWQEMEEKIDTERTWQSLKEHFQKKILPNIKKYNLPSEEEKSFCKIVHK